MKRITLTLVRKTMKLMKKCIGMDSRCSHFLISTDIPLSNIPFLEGVGMFTNLPIARLYCFTANNVGCSLFRSGAAPVCVW